MVHDDTMVHLLIAPTVLRLLVRATVWFSRESLPTENSSPSFCPQKPRTLCSFWLKVERERQN